MKISAKNLDDRERNNLKVRKSVGSLSADRSTTSAAGLSNGADASVGRSIISRRPHDYHQRRRQAILAAIWVGLGVGRRARRSEPPSRPSVSYIGWEDPTAEIPTAAKNSECNIVSR